MNIKQHIRYFFFFMMGGLLVSCGKMDAPYNEFLQGGEIVYNGKAEMLQAFPGNNRIKLKWYIISDPKITHGKIFWNNPAHIEGETPIPGQRPGGRDSLEVRIQRSADTDSVEVIIDKLIEGVYTFDVYMYDDLGHSSVKAEVISDVYGTAYQATVANRPIGTLLLDTIGEKSDLYIPWFGIAQQAVAVELQYTDVSGEAKTMQITQKPHPIDPRRGTVWQERDTIFNYMEGTGFKYRTAYLPDPTAIDTFYTAYTDLQADDIAYFMLPPPPVEDANFALGKKVTFSSSSGPLTDGDRTTGSGRWQPSSGERADLNVWFYVDLGETTEINTAGLYIPKDPHKVPYFEILTTTEAEITSSTKWTRAYVQFEAPQAENVITFPAIEARYVKVSLNLVAENANINVSEFELYNIP
ncbi:DUF4998 domain-containing protein [Parapedobacter soli]|uniref:DUF4998 domain-containing protein n=1 Tax=Parapedobacter soli TaxID=416955 RepID=UPI0021C754A9|nr:DUF4998 domain-containing protein [Parapedobacter soli]